MLLACGQPVIIFRAMKTAASGLMTYKRNMEIYLAQSLIAGYILALLTGCSGLPRNPLPVEDIRRAEIPGMSGVRAWGGQLNADFQADLVASIKQEPAGVFPLDENGYPIYHGLALSDRDALRCRFSQGRGRGTQSW